MRTATESIADRTLEGGEQALQELPNVGEGIARIIDGYVGSGGLEMLERLKGEVAPGKLLTEVPGIGEELAQGIAEDGFGGLFG